MVKNAKIQKFKWDVFVDFKTLCNSKELSLLHSFIYTGFTVRGDGYQWSADWLSFFLCSLLYDLHDTSPQAIIKLYPKNILLLTDICFLFNCNTEIWPSFEVVGTTEMLTARLELKADPRTGTPWRPHIFGCKMTLAAD